MNDLKLIIHLDSHSFSYSIFNTHNNCFEKVKRYPIEWDEENFLKDIETILNTDSNIQNTYKHTLCVVDSQTSTFIPEVLFEKKQINNYLNFTSKKNIACETKYIKQQFSDCYSIFSINKNLESLLTRKFKSIKIKNTASLLVDYALSRSQLETYQILAQVNSNNFHIILIQNGKFNFYNKFQFNTSEDFLYYFMNCLHTLSITSNNSKIWIMSELDIDHKLFEKLKKYTPIVFIERPDNFLYGDSIMEKASHKYHNLFSQLICE